MTLPELVAMRRVAGWLADPEAPAVVSAIAACRAGLREEDRLAVKMYEQALRIRASFPPLDVPTLSEVNALHAAGKINTDQAALMMSDRDTLGLCRQCPERANDEDGLCPACRANREAE